MRMNEKFIQNSDPIEDLRIGKKHWFDEVERIFKEDVFTNDLSVSIYMNVAHDKLEELFKKGLDPMKASDIVYNDKDIMDQWKKRMRMGYHGEPMDDLKANCRSWQEGASIKDVEKLIRYLIDRHPDYNENDLRDMAYDWCGIDDKENKDLDESYIMKSLFEGCGCGKKRPPISVPGEPSPIIENPIEDIEEPIPMPPPPPPFPIPESLNEGCNCGGRRKVRTLLSSINRPRPKPTTKPIIRPRPQGPKLHEKFTEDSDPIYDLGIGIQPKDLMRIKDIIKKARGYRWEERKLAETMCKLITDKNKAFRRYLAAKSIKGDDWDVTKIFLRRAQQLGHERALKIHEDLNKKIVMKKLNEKQNKYDIKTIAKIAVKIIGKWIHRQDSQYFDQEINYLLKKQSSYGELKEFIYDFLDAHIDTFFTIFTKYNNIERLFLEEHKDEILDNIIEELGKPPTEKSDVEQIIKRSKEKQNAPKDYSEMSQYDLKKEVDKALDAKDFDTLRKIQPYLKEGFLKYHVNDFLNENRDDEYIMPKLK